MADFANKTFFKFLFGFIAIIASSFIVLSIVGYYSDAETTASAVIEGCEDGAEKC